MSLDCLCELCVSPALSAVQYILTAEEGQSKHELGKFNHDVYSCPPAFSGLDGSVAVYLF